MLSVNEKLKGFELADPVFKAAAAFLMVQDPDLTLWLHETEVSTRHDDQKITTEFKGVFAKKGWHGHFELTRVKNTLNSTRKFDFSYLTFDLFESRRERHHLVEMKGLLAEVNKKRDKTNPSWTVYPVADDGTLSVRLGLDSFTTETIVVSFLTLLKEAWVVTEILRGFSNRHDQNLKLAQQELEAQLL